MDNFLTTLETSLFDSIKNLLDPINIITGGISVFAVTIVTAWALYQAMLIMTGQSGDSFIALMKDFFLKVFILSFVFGTAPNYKEFIVDPAIATVDSLSEELSGSEGVFEKVDEVLLTAVMAMQDMKAADAEQDNATTSWWGKLWNTVTISFGQIWKSFMNFLQFTVIGIGAVYLAAVAFLKALQNPSFLEML